MHTFEVGKSRRRSGNKSNAFEYLYHMGRMKAVASLEKYRYLDAYDLGEDEFSNSWIIHHISVNAYEVPSHAPNACVGGCRGQSQCACDHVPFHLYRGHVRANAHGRGGVRARGHADVHGLPPRACVRAHGHDDARVHAYVCADVYLSWFAPFTWNDLAPMNFNRNEQAILEQFLAC